VIRPGVWPLLVLAGCLPAHRVVYDDGLSRGWEVEPRRSSETRRALAVELAPDGALTLHTRRPFDGMGALVFRVRGDAARVGLRLASTADGVVSGETALRALAPMREDEWIEVRVHLEGWGPRAWDGVVFHDRSGLGASLELDQVLLLRELPSPAGYTAAAPLGTDAVLLHGAGDPSSIAVTLDGVPHEVVEVQAASEPPRTLVRVVPPLRSGTLVVETSDGSFTRTIRGAVATLGGEPTHAISELVYGAAWIPTDGEYVSTHGIGLARWGGNHVGLYDPDRDVVNAGADWYFQNRRQEDAGEWLTEQHDQGMRTLLTVPGLDWVAKDRRSHSYSVRRYGPQQATDPNQRDAGNGRLPDGRPITTNDPTDAAKPWTSAELGTWLSGLPERPAVVAVWNELDIAHETHQDVHPEPAGYDELLARYLEWAEAIGEAVPEALLAAPSSSNWWFYWNSGDETADRLTHGGEDLLPWFLGEVAAADASQGQRTLDLLDVHYYDWDVVNEDASEATRALRLRSTRSLWDPTYTSEGWMGTQDDVTPNQPSPHQLQLIPRLRRLIDEEYPGTRLGLSEWNLARSGTCRVGWQWRTPWASSDARGWTWPPTGSTPRRAARRRPRSGCSAVTGCASGTARCRWSSRTPICSECTPPWTTEGR